MLVEVIITDSVNCGLCQCPVDCGLCRGWACGALFLVSKKIWNEHRLQTPNLNFPGNFGIPSIKSDPLKIFLKLVGLLYRNIRINRTFLGNKVVNFGSEGKFKLLNYNVKWALHFQTIVWLLETLSESLKQNYRYCLFRVVFHIFHIENFLKRSTNLEVLKFP